MKAQQYSDMVERGEFTCSQAVAAILNDQGTSPQVKVVLTRTMSNLGAGVGATFDATNEETMRDSLEWIFEQIASDPKAARTFIEQVEKTDATSAVR